MPFPIPNSWSLSVRTFVAYETVFDTLFNFCSTIAGTSILSTYSIASPTFLVNASTPSPNNLFANELTLSPISILGGGGGGGGGNSGP